MEQNDNENLLLGGQEFVSSQKIIIGAEDDPETLNEFDNTVAEKIGGKRREVALVFDRYYEKAPSAGLLLIAKIVFCCALCVCSMMFITENLALPLSPMFTAVCCAGCTAAFSIAFVFVKKGIALPVMMFACSVVLWQNRETFWDRLSYFIDAVMLQMDGRLLETKGLISHPELLLQSENGLINPAYADELKFGMGLLCAVFSLIVAMSMFKKPHFIPILVPFLAMWTPRMLAERFVWNVWLIPTAALFAAALAMTIAHKDGLAIRRGFTHSYRSIVARNEHLFNLRTEHSAFMRKITLRGAYNSKYFLLSASAAAMFLAVVLIANTLTENSRGIDYTKLYDYVKELGSGSGGVTSPFKNGPVSEYFTSPVNTDFNQGSGLAITNPGNGSQEILRVKNNGSLPVYLRGDVGIDFDGDSWSSPVASQPEGWDDYLSERFGSDMSGLIASWQDMHAVEQSEFMVDYLCDTSVMFLPSYITFLYTYVDSDEFDVYGDYAVRANDGAGKLNTVLGEAYTPIFLGVDDETVYDADTAAAAAAKLASVPFDSDDMWVHIKDNGDWEYVYNEDYYQAYSAYVYDTYLNVPAGMEAPLTEFIRENLAADIALVNIETSNELEARYRTAKLIADYLRGNYTYSLSASVSRRDPVMSFLNDTKSGHCALYASSMTLMLRLRGIPARYCTGFVAKPSGEDVLTLRSRNLHAWVEVYLDRLGWVTFDPTSSVVVDSVVNGTPLPPESSETSDTSESSETSEISDSSDIPPTSPNSSPLSSDTLPDSSETDGSSVSASVVMEHPSVLPYLLGILGILAVIGVIVLIIVKIRQFDKNAKKALRRCYTADNSRSVYARLLAMLRLRKLTPNKGELSGNFFKRAGKVLGVDLAGHIDLLESLAFGSGELDDTEKAQLGRLLERVFTAADKKSDPIGKIRLRLIALSKRF
ncbi:MAG: transglutaminase-like domain-containing protein [Oscillospiraceae bacterium]|nr:transglutaminase-like domain-containing protein [Oscillospiraceae bacterium]